MFPRSQIIKRFGSYELIQKIKSGGMATVFRAQKHGEEGFSMPCAVKIIHPHLAEQKSFTEMFIREAKLASKLSHPNIVQVIDFGSVNYNYYLVMEFIDGSDLFSLIEYRFSLPQDIALSILFEISKALIYAHEKGIIHRDISSGNILISDHAAVKIADFGIAQANQFENFTREGMVRGKGTYMSPEQSRGENLNEKTDIFSLGIVFLEMAEGFDRLKAKRDRKLKEEELMPRDLDHEVAEVILRMLKEAPKERISTIELYQKLKDLADQQFFSPNEDLLKSMIKGIPRTEEFQGTEVSESAHDPDAFIPTTKYERTPERPIGRPGLKNSLKIWPGIILVLTLIFLGIWILVDKWKTGRHKSEGFEQKGLELLMEKSEASKDYQEQFLREKKDEIVIAPKKEITKKVRLKARLRYSKITILSLIPVEVYLDGKLLGKTPLRDLNLKAGKKLFKFKILGDGSIVEKEIKLKRGQSHRLFLDNSVLDLE